MITFPNAKINLGLNIVEKRPDGYHNLETIFYPINLQDALEVKRLHDSDLRYDLHVMGNTIDGPKESNLVVKAYELLAQDFEMPAVDIHLFKHIPTQAGLGGGSADCAFMIKLLNEKFKLGLDLNQMESYAAKLGADCAFFVRNEPVFATGIGNIFEPISVSLSGHYIVIVKPNIAVPTRDAFALVKPHHPAVSLKESIQQPLATWKDSIKNDFEDSVFTKYPDIAAIKDKLYDMGAIYASMSGSGSAVYGIFNHFIEEVDQKFVDCFCRQREMI